MNFRAQAIAMIFAATGLNGFASDGGSGTGVCIGGGGGKDSTHTVTSSNLDYTAPLVDIDFVDLHGDVLNPEHSRVLIWDTAKIDMYGLDMARFRDTIRFTLNDPESGHNFTMPVGGIMTSGFGHRSLYGRTFHKGVDLDLETGDPVKAAMSGIVRIAHYNRGYGNFVVIVHDGGLETLYGHMSELKVKEGQEVKSGDIIGLGGSTGQSTGPHLHFEVRVMGTCVDPSRIIGLDAARRKIPQAITVNNSWFDYLAALSQGSYHVVQEGQTLKSIADMYETSAEDILRLNELRKADDIVPGMRLRLD